MFNYVDATEIKEIAIKISPTSGDRSTISIENIGKQNIEIRESATLVAHHHQVGHRECYEFDFGDKKLFIYVA